MISPIDDSAIAHWDDYSRARDAMLERTSHPDAPWVIVRANDKKEARLNVIRDILCRIDPKHEDDKPDSEVVFGYDVSAAHKLAR